MLFTSRSQGGALGSARPLESALQSPRAVHSGQRQRRTGTHTCQCAQRAGTDLKFSEIFDNVFP